MINILTKIKQIQKLNDQEIKHNIPSTASWHNKYKDSAYIYISGFPKEVTEGDLVIVFSQYGEIVDCRIVRDKITGKSKCFGYICYEDQRSTILAVDNLNGIKIGGNFILVDHVEEYRLPKEYNKDENNEDGEKKIYKLTGPDGRGWGKDRILNEEDKLLFDKIQKEEILNENKIILDVVDKNCILNLDEDGNEQDTKWEDKFNELVNKKKKEINKKYEKKHKKQKHD